MDEVIYEAGLPSGREGHLPLHSHDKEEYSASSLSENEKAKMGADVEILIRPWRRGQFTLRAVLVGCALGAIIAASNVYLGLKTGFTFGAGLFGSIFGFAILKPLSTSAPSYLGGGYFGPKENNVAQAAASAAGSLGLLFTSGFPAAYQLGLLNATPQEDIGRLFTFTICCAFFGLAFSIPLRKFYILKLKLVFPSGVASAYTIRSLHVGKSAALDAKRKTKALILSFCFAITLRVVSEYAPGILWDWHLFYTLSRIGWTSAINAESWGWIWEWTPAFIGAGMLTGINASYSFLGGSFLAWAIIGPIIVRMGKAFGIPANPNIPGYMNYSSISLTDPVNHPSPRYWLVWPGTLMLLCTSFAEVGCNWKSIYAAVRTMASPVTERFYKHSLDGADAPTSKDEIVDPVPASERVPFWMWGSVFILSVIISCVVMGVQFGQNVGITLLAIIFAFLFSFIGCESSGRTNINPVTSIGMCFCFFQFFLEIPDARDCYYSNPLFHPGAAEQAADMIGDLKTAHLLRSSPKAVFGGQLCGAIVSIFMSAGVYVVFSTAYPCINDLKYATCSFPTPDVQSWRVRLLLLGVGWDRP
ncbi:OPT oligopeptide transporter protein-domain-containing protein [Boletus reticuloceps]|uniref:OPT oligopeptide transporter protein-domain-containing protein n=1 Tax=Boletus reticuloceps TaxID=495285 RepID=A0A8I2YPY3_9AGAM|nr:OPT oligopeptide transporter protein-domain-containing protein [Boletus reticuloceps]